ncbi:mannose-6-phosphate isomerase [Brevibacillus choshinensis]|uniref:Mannose-6-phosphate isomerase n=1 Tax=Brevibacillus choshinensis TaxID=54911 RepID=A0ABR5N692_BRECH|nr:cysteine dioxygenase family protein [Brevibacillus choshinensis]KQL46134.1 mannose-6-phosphate isomerase [Brevibacillus choshinensis]
MIQALLEKAFRTLTCPTPADLRQALESLPLSMETVAPIIPEPAGLPYGRRVLLVTEHIEIVLIQLPPAQESVPHNHGDSFGWEWILSGDLTNVIYSLAEDGQEVRPEKSITVRSGEFCYVSPGEIHAIRNQGEIPVVSINAYTPPLNHCQQFEAQDYSIF